MKARSRVSLTVSKAALLEVVQKAYALAPPKSSLQILSNLKLSCSPERIEITATDLDQSIRCSCPAEGTADFQVAINARKLFDIVREIPDGDISIEEDENVLSIVSDKGFSCKVAGADVADFPEFPNVQDTTDVDMLVTDFRRTVTKASFAVSKDATRSCLCGVLWEIEGDRCTMVATDGHRLGRSHVLANTGITENVSVIVSPKTLLHVSRIVDSDDPDATMAVSIGEKYLVVGGENFTLCSKLIEGPYPDYSKVIPKSNPKSALLSRATLIDAVRRVSVLSNQKTHLVKFHFDGNTLEVMVLNRDIGGEAREVVAVEYDGEEHTIGFNAQYLSEILQIAQTDKVRLEMNTQISACLILPWNEDTTAPVDTELFLIMPLRLMDEV